jgi:Tat protein translocase TatB subunit
VFGHFPELIIILVIALIVFGPEKLPEVAANAGKMVRELREVMNTAMNPIEEEIPDDFSSYYYESLARAGEDVPESYEPPDAHQVFYELDSQDEEAELHEPVGELEATNGHAPVPSRRKVTRVVRPRARPPS